jgi:hypothetical protein
VAGTRLSIARRAALTVLVAALCLGPRPARAISEDPQRVVYGNAAALHKGEIQLGLFSPFLYALQDRITLMTHPILDLLLTPNVFLRLNLVAERRFTVSLDGGYAQSFLKTTTGSSPGFGTVSVIHSFYLWERLTLTGRYAYQFTFSPPDNYVVPQAFATVFLTSDWLLHLDGVFPYRLGGGGFQDVSGKLVVMRRISTAVIALGVSVGRIYVVDAPRLKNPVESPVYPVVDVVWEF